MTRKSPNNEYDILEQVGNGSFGSVHRAKNKATDNIVAVKVMKKQTSSDGSHLREYKLMKQLVHHPNIVQFYDSFVSTRKDLCFVMEFMNGGNLCQLINDRSEAKELIALDQVRDIMRQIIAALAHLHEHGIFHRDLKPENILLRDTCPMEIKLGDFGLARQLKSRPPYTEYVSTRWYRAPEVLLHSTSYSYPVDLWAVGAICAEVATLRPLFPGQSEIDQLYRICELVGSPTSRKSSLAKGKRTAPAPVVAATASDACEWPEGIRLANKLGFEFPQLPPKPLSAIIPNADELLLNMIRQFLHLNPSKRLKAKDALSHPFLHSDGTAATEAPPTLLPPLRPSTSMAQELKAAFLGSRGKRKEKASDPPHTAAKSPDTLHPQDISVSATSDLELPSIPLSPFVISPDWSFCKASTAARLSILQAGIPSVPLHEDTLEHPSTHAILKHSVPRHLPSLPRPSLSTPLFSKDASSVIMTLPNATKSTSTFSNLFGIRSPKKHRRAPQSQQKDSPHAIPRTESSPASLFKSSGQSQHAHNRSLSMMTIHNTRPPPPKADIPNSKKKTNRLSFWSKKQAEETHQEDVPLL